MTPTQLYRFFDVADRLIYVGIAHDTWKRYSQHQSRSPWAREILRVTIEHHPTRGTAVDAEAKAILVEKPRYNKAGRSLPPALDFDTAQEMAKLEAWLGRQQKPE